MRLTANELAREAAATGFQTEPLEKVILLLEARPLPSRLPRGRLESLRYKSGGDPPPIS